MELRTLISAMVIGALTINCGVQEPDHSHSVNALLGDISFIKRFGHPPDASTNEDLRIRTHLEYVETHLRSRDCSDMPAELRARRAQLLDLLHEYRKRGVFPRNRRYIDRRVPCFIDDDGRICAVGYLIEQSVDREAAEGINKEHKYERLLEMNDTAVDEWIVWSGLSKEECAWIQPEYGFQNANRYNHIEPLYGVSTSILVAANLSLSTINTVQMITEQRKKTVPVIGILTGAGQVILGAVMMPKETQSTYGFTSNESEKILSMINIALGTTTMILSIWNLATIPQSEAIGWNIYPIPASNGETGIGMSILHRF